MFFFLFNYHTESLQALITGTDEKALRKWNWFLIKEFALLDWVSVFSSIALKAQQTTHTFGRLILAIVSRTTMKASAK